MARISFASERCRQGGAARAQVAEGVHVRFAYRRAPVQMTMLPQVVNPFENSGGAAMLLT